MDYIHMRWLVGSVSDWDELFAQAYRALKPGGWIESHEGAPIYESDDGTVTETSALGQWGKLFVNFGEEIGRSFEVVDEGTQKLSMQSAGFVDIQESEFKVCRGGIWHNYPSSLA
jgi:CBS domain-containing protein